MARVAVAMVLFSRWRLAGALLRGHQDTDHLKGLQEQDTGVNDAVQMVFQTESLLPYAAGPCTPQELSSWQKRGKTTLELIDAWNELRPEGVVYVSLAEGACLVGPDSEPLSPEPRNMSESDSNETINATDDAFGDTTEELFERGVGTRRSPSHTSVSAVQALTLVRTSTPPICTGLADVFQWVMPEVFTVSGPMLKYGDKRNNAVVWPRPGVCRPEAPCPVVVFLSGIGEHSDGSTPEEFLRSFESVHKFGFTRYVDRDPDCVENQGAVLLFPELARDENWVRDGPSALKFYILPLLETVRQRAPPLVDMDRVAVVGYSEGAFGALQAAVLYPDVFSFTVAAAASTREDWWAEVPIPLRSPRLVTDEAMHPWKLQMVLVALGEFDNTGNQAANLRNALRLLDNSAVSSRAAVQVRYYAGLYHKEVWERVFNQWTTFHDIFWQGRYRSSRDGLEKAVHLQADFKEVAQAAASAPQHPIARQDIVFAARAAEAIREAEARRIEIEKALETGELDCDPDLPDCIPCSRTCPLGSNETCHVCCRLTCWPGETECTLCGADDEDAAANSTNNTGGTNITMPGGASDAPNGASA